MLMSACIHRPYDGKWSKSMVGYGDEDSHFVLELTYNYGIKHYAKGNDFKVIKVIHFPKHKMFVPKIILYNLYTYI